MKRWGALGEPLYPGRDVRSKKLFINKPFYAFQLTGKAIQILSSKETVSNLTVDKHVFERLLKNINWSVPTKSHIFTFWGNLRQISLKKWKWNSLRLVGSSYRYSPTLTNSPHVRRHIGNITTKMQCDPSVHKAWARSSRLNSYLGKKREDILYYMAAWR